MTALAIGPPGSNGEHDNTVMRSLPFEPTVLAISPTNARAQPISQRARHAGGQPSPADLVGQAVRLRGLLQASPKVCQGVTQVCQGLLVVHSPGGGGGGDLLPGYFLVMPHNARGVHREG